ncbi:hypothetical protein ACFL4N_04500 [Thermodesulfobacteriota bacterium]
MKIQIAQTRHGLIISFLGMAAVFLAAAIIILPYFLEPAPGREEADKRIRLLLKREFFHHEMAMLKGQGRRLPDHDRARQWKEKIGRINRTRFLSIRVKRLIPDILLLDPTPHFAVRVVVQENGRDPDTRYFLLSTAGMDRETTYVAWFFSI